MLGKDNYLYEDYLNQSDKNEQKFSNKWKHYYTNDNYLIKRSNSDSKIYVDEGGYLLRKEKIDADFNNNKKLKRSHSYLEVVEYKIGNT